MNDFATLIVASETGKSVNDSNQDKYVEIIQDRGIVSAELSYRGFKFGKADPEAPGTGQVYRKFFYNKEGKLVKKFDFDTNGDIISKEESTYDKVQKWKLLRRKTITGEDSSEEHYTYTVLKGKHKLKRYSFQKAKWPRPKEELYEHDKLGRISKKTSYGLLGDPEFITYYTYDSDQDTKVTYRSVTLPDDSLVFTLMYQYDAKKEKLTGMFSFMLTPDEVTELRRTDKEWELQSVSGSKWEYDTHGNNILFLRDEKYSSALDMLTNPEERWALANRRIITTKTSRDFKKISGKFYLVRETEWLTRMDEPLKAIKDFSYYDSNNEIIYSPETS